MADLNKIVLRGFKSIKDASLELRRMNVLIGSNGAGKSNLVSFFKMLNEMMGGRLQQFVATSGRAQSVLHFGPKVTPQLESQLEFGVDGARDIYRMRLFHAAGDTLVFAEETLSYHRSGFQEPKTVSLGAGHLETQIGVAADGGDKVARVFRHVLNHYRVYHFHDTSLKARVQQYAYLDDNRWLMPDAGNLAAFLYRLREENEGSAYQRIIHTVRLIAPFFADFDLQPSGPNKKEILLNWRQKDSDQVFGPHQLSDGTLRAICLVTLLLQPVDELPDLIIVDEPELGLHPYALTVVAQLFSKAATHKQVLLSTQSSSFLDNFEPEDIVIVERQDGSSTFVRPDAEALSVWLKEYSLGEVWEKNIIGGGPH